LFILKKNIDPFGGSDVVPLKRYWFENHQKHTPNIQSYILRNCHLELQN